MRVAAACRTPLVSAIGHHLDTPLLDLVADFRASTPTDAAKRIVPDVSEERSRITQARLRARAALTGRLQREQSGLEQLRSRPVLRNPTTLVDQHEHRVEALRESGRRALHTGLVHGLAEVAGLAAQVRALSPAATLDRGYAVVQTTDGHVVRDPGRRHDGRRPARPGRPRRAHGGRDRPRRAADGGARRDARPGVVGHARHGGRPRAPCRGRRAERVGRCWLTVPVPKASPNTPNADVSALGYEQARDELVSVVARLEAGAQTLEESLALWERGEALAARCQEWLDGARQRLTAVRAKAGPPAATTTPTTRGRRDHARRHRGAAMTAAAQDRALVVGEALIDEVVRPDGSRERHPGGSPANVAIGLGRLGRSVDLLTWLGEDADGDLVRRAPRPLARARADAVTGARPGRPWPRRTSTPQASPATSSTSSGTCRARWDGADGDPLVVHTGSIATVLQPGGTAVERLIARSQAAVDHHLRPEPAPRPDGLPGARAAGRERARAAWPTWSRSATRTSRGCTRASRRPRSPRSGAGRGRRSSSSRTAARARSPARRRALACRSWRRGCRSRTPSAPATRSWAA